MRQLFKTILMSLLITPFHNLNQEIIIRYSVSYISICIMVMKSLLTHHWTYSLYIESKLKWCNPNYLSVFHFQSLIIEKSRKQCNTWLLKHCITLQCTLYKVSQTKELQAVEFIFLYIIGLFSNSFCFFIACNLDLCLWNYRLKYK